MQLGKETKNLKINLIINKYQYTQLKRKEKSLHVHRLQRTSVSHEDYNGSNSIL